MEAISNKKLLGFTWWWREYEDRDVLWRSLPCYTMEDIQKGIVAEQQNYGPGDSDSGWVPMPVIEAIESMVLLDDREHMAKCVEDILDCWARWHYHPLPSLTRKASRN